MTSQKVTRGSTQTICIIIKNIFYEVIVTDDSSALIGLYLNAIG
jgi:hypothetical protein